MTASNTYTSSVPAQVTVNRTTGLVTGIGTTTNTSVSIWAYYAGVYVTNTLTIVPTPLPVLKHR